MNPSEVDCNGMDECLLCPGRWHYLCEDIYLLAKAQQPGRTSYRLKTVGVRRDSSSQYDAYFDHVVLNRQQTVSDVCECFTYTYGLWTDSTPSHTHTYTHTHMHANREGGGEHTYTCTHKCMHRHVSIHAEHLLSRNHNLDLISMMKVAKAKYEDLPD